MDKNQIGGSTVIAVRTADTIQQDASCKIILKDRYFLAGILKAVAAGYKDVPLKDIAVKYIEPDRIRTVRRYRGILQMKALL